MSSFYRSKRCLQSNVCSYRYPSYLMKESPPQVCSNFDSNNMLLLPKICNKYYVRKNSNSVMNNIHYIDDLSVKSNVELNNTSSMKLTSNKFKMTNKATDDYIDFDSCSHHSFESFNQSLPRDFRYPSYLMKVSPPQQVRLNFNSNNMLLLPKICNKYCVRKNSNIITNNIYCSDDLSSKSTVELNSTISMKPISSKFKIMNKVTDNYTGFDSGSHDSFGHTQQSDFRNFRCPSNPMKVSLPQVCTNLENMLITKSSEINYAKKNTSILMENSHHFLDGVCIKSSEEDIKSTSLNINKTIKTTNTRIDIKQEDNCLTLTTNDLKTEGVMKIEDKVFNDFGDQEQFLTKDDEVKLFKICEKCHKSWNIDNFEWEKISKTNKIKLLELIKQNSKSQETYSILSKSSINNSNQNLILSKTNCLDKTQDNISI